MTEDNIALQTLLEKSVDADLLREMIGFTCQRLMELEMEGNTGTPYGENNPDRLAQLIDDRVLLVGGFEPPVASRRRHRRFRGGQADLLVLSALPALLLGFGFFLSLKTPRT